MLEKVSSKKADWTRVAFGDVVRKVSDKVDPWESGLERYVAGEHMDTDDLRIRRWGLIGDDYLGPAFHMRFKPGHVLYGSRRTYLRKVALAEFEGITANTTFVLESKDPKRLMPELLPFLMQTEAFHTYSIARSKGSVNPYVNFSDIADFQFSLPPMQEQARCIELLRSLRSAIDCLYDTRVKAWTVWRSLSRLEFGPRSNRGGMLADHYQIQMGQVDPRDAEYQDLPLVGPNHIAQINGQFLGSESAASQNAISGKYLFEEDAVLYSKIRPELRKAMISEFRGLCSADIYPLVPSSDLIPAYLLDLVLSDAFSAFAISCSMRTGMPKLNRDQLSRFEFELPNLEHQREYVGRATQLKARCKEISNRLKNATKIKDLALSEMLQ